MDVKKNGLFDFAICSHVLEDIASPQFVSEMLCKIAKEGFIAVPSKNIELSREINGPYLGHVHHRWIYNKENNKFVAYPKLNFLEFCDHSDIINKFYHTIDELCFFWKDNFELNVINNDFMGPNVESVYGYFNNLNFE
jgi:2-polyprenyl-3-methyl-5-hydroxy-6-metoxy-1,4-benzoquinol methylase